MAVSAAKNNHFIPVLHIPRFNNPNLLCMLIPISGKYPSHVFLKIAGDIRSDYGKDHRKNLHFHVCPGLLLSAASNALSGSPAPCHQPEKPVEGYSGPDRYSCCCNWVLPDCLTGRADGLGRSPGNRLFQPSIRPRDHCLGHEDVFFGYLPTFFHGSSSPLPSGSAG